MANKLDNLMSVQELNSRRTPEQHSADSRKAGIRSGEVRREKATMISTLKKILDEDMGNGKTFREMATLGLIKGAVKGNALNYKTIMEALGEGKGEDNTNGVLVDLVEAIKDAKKSQ